MVKKSSKSEKSPSPPPTGKMVLRVRANQKMKQVESTEEKLAKKPKTAVKKKAAAKIDADKPKKPPTAFFYFLEDFRKDFQEQNPAVKSMRDVGKACGEKWKKMTYEEKVQYYDIATEKRAEFDRAMADYVKWKESGIDTNPEESESESDYEE